MVVLVLGGLGEVCTSFSKTGNPLAGELLSSPTADGGLWGMCVGGGGHVEVMGAN